MKKYALVLFIFIFSFGLFNSNINSTRQKVFAQAGSCYFTPPAGLPACNNGCYVPTPGPSGGAPSDYWKCVVGGGYAPPTYSCTGTIPAGNTACPGTGAGLTSSRPYASVATCSASQANKCEYYTQVYSSGGSGGCSLSGSVKEFDSFPPEPYPDYYTAHYNAHYRGNGGFLPYNSGSRLLSPTPFGYTVIDISDRGNPQSLLYEDYRVTPGYLGDGPIQCPGDCLNSIGSVAVSTDGQRAIFNMGVGGMSIPGGFGLMVGQPSGTYGFRLMSGSVAGGRGAESLLQKVGDKYFAYTLLSGSFGVGSFWVADVTTLPLDGLDAITAVDGNGNALNSIPYSLAPSLPNGYSATLSGYWITYMDGTGKSINLVNATNPLPASALTAKQFTAADFGRPSSDSFVVFTVAQDPSNPAAVYLLGTFTSITQAHYTPDMKNYIQATQTPTGYTLIRVLGGVPTIVGSFLPSAGETSMSSSLTADNAGNLFAFMKVRTSTGSYRQYSSSVRTFGATPGFFDVTTPNIWSASTFVAGTQPGQIYDYYKTSDGLSRVIPMTCSTGTTIPPPVAICQDSTSLNYGGTLPCRYPPTIRPACSPGDSFNTDTGLPCGGATGTGRKLSCVNLSSSIYCSYTGDTLVTATPPTSLPPTPPPPVLPPTQSFQFTLLLKLGSTGSEVVALQNFLNKADYYSGAIDGKFGPATEAAVIKFQIANGLVGDGIVGAQTRALLNGTSTTASMTGSVSGGTCTDTSTQSSTTGPVCTQASVRITNGPSEIYNGVAGYGRDIYRNGTNYYLFDPNLYAQLLAKHANDYDKWSLVGAGCKGQYLGPWKVIGPLFSSSTCSQAGVRYYSPPPEFLSVADFNVWDTYMNAGKDAFALLTVQTNDTTGEQYILDPYLGGPFEQLKIADGFPAATNPHTNADGSISYNYDNVPAGTISTGTDGRRWQMQKSALSYPHYVAYIQNGSQYAPGQEPDTSKNCTLQTTTATFRDKSNCH